MKKVAKLITIIDDDGEDIDFLRSAILATDPFVKCNAFSSPQEALERISKDSIPPDIIFVDYNMPVFNGIECVQVFNALRVFNYTTYVAISSHMPPSLERAFVDHGVDYAFEKPTSIEGYKKVVEQVFGKIYGSVVMNPND